MPSSRALHAALAPAKNERNNQRALKTQTSKSDSPCKKTVALAHVLRRIPTDHPSHPHIRTCTRTRPSCEPHYLSLAWKQLRPQRLQSRRRTGGQPPAPEQGLLRPGAGVTAPQAAAAAAPRWGRPGAAGRLPRTCPPGPLAASPTPTPPARTGHTDTSELGLFGKVSTSHGWLGANPHPHLHPAAGPSAAQHSIVQQAGPAER